MHAEALLLKGLEIAARSGGVATLGHLEMQRVYRLVCREQRFVARPWNPVAKLLNQRLHLSGKPLKTYRYERDPHTGERIRKRVYIFRSPMIERE
ncbi:MAG: hypothetical protein SH859_17205 [Hyphomicrobium aestuarii]|nr:hypothetical protein [Hyphomicrobium aestuarii]